MNKEQSSKATPKRKWSSDTHRQVVGLLNLSCSSVFTSYGGMNWNDLYRQKLNLLALQSKKGITHKQYELVEGLLSFLDCLTDAAVDEGLLTIDMMNAATLEFSRSK